MLSECSAWTGDEGRVWFGVLMADEAGVEVIEDMMFDREKLEILD